MGTPSRISVWFGQLAALVRLTVRGAIRRPAVPLLFTGMLVLIAILRPITLFAFEREEMMIREMGISTIRLAGLLTLLLYGATIVAREREERTILSIVTRPVARASYLAGKWVGLVVVVSGVMVGGGLLLTWVVGGVFWHAIWGGIYLALCQMAMLASLILLLQVRLGGQWAAIGGVFAFVLGNLSPFFADRLGRLGGTVTGFLLPNLQALNAEEWVGMGIAPTGKTCLLATVVMGLYSISFVALAVGLFEKQELA